LLTGEQKPESMHLPARQGKAKAALAAVYLVRHQKMLAERRPAAAAAELPLAACSIGSMLNAPQDLLQVLD